MNKILKSTVREAHKICFKKTPYTFSARDTSDPNTSTGWKVKGTEENHANRPMRPGKFILISVKNRL